MKLRELFVIGGLTLAGACAPAPPTHDNAADLAAIGKVRDAYAAAFKAGDAAAIGAMFTADGRSMENEAPTAVGSSAIATGLKAMMDQMSATELVITPEKTEVSGDLAYDLGTFKATVTPKAGGGPMTNEGRYLVVLKRQADGSFKLAADMGNIPMPAAPPPPAAKK